MQLNSKVFTKIMYNITDNIWKHNESKFTGNNSEKS